MQIKCHKCGQAFSTVTSLSKHRRFCDSTPTPSPYGLTPSPIKSPPPLKNGSVFESNKSPSSMIRQSSAPVSSAPAQVPAPPPPPLYPGMLQPYLLQQAMANSAASLPFYPNFLQQLARFQNQAQLSSLLQNKTENAEKKTSPLVENSSTPEKSFDVNRNKSNGQNTPEKSEKTPLDLSVASSKKEDEMENSDNQEHDKETIENNE